MDSEQGRKGKDYSKYSFNGGKYNKRDLVLAVVKFYMEQHQPTHDVLLKTFPDKLQGSRGVVKKKDQILDERRYSMDFPLRTSDGVEVVVCNQWGLLDDGYNTIRQDIGNFIEHVEKTLGYKIEKIDHKTSVTQNPKGTDMNWENSQAQRVCDECFDGDLPEMDEYAVLYLNVVAVEPRSPALSLAARLPWSFPPGLEPVIGLDLGEHFRAIIENKNPVEWWKHAKKLIDDELQKYNYEDIAESPSAVEKAVKKGTVISKSNQGLVDEEKVRIILENEFGRLTKKKIVIGQIPKEFDLVSDDNQLVIEVKSYKFGNETTKKAGYTSTRKARLITACAYLDNVPAKRKMLVLTNAELHKQFKIDMVKIGMFPEVEIRYVPIT